MRKSLDFLKISTLFFILIAIQMCIFQTTSTAAPFSDKANYKEGEVLVKFKSGIVSTSSVKAHQAVGAKVVKKFKLVQNLEKVELPEGVSVKEAVQSYMVDPNVEYAEPNYIRTPMAEIPFDTYFADQWALNNTGQFAGGTEDADIDAPEAWDITTGSKEVVVAILDGGIDYTHPDLIDNIWINISEACSNGIDDDFNGYIDDCQGWNFFHNHNEPLDESGHGTHVAGIVGAVGNNFIGAVGVMWHTNLMPVKFIGYHDDPEECGGTTNFCGTTDDEIEGIEYAVANGADVVNMSFGGYEYSQAEYDTIAAAGAQQVVFVASAGNETNNNDEADKLYPASYGLPNIISVAATDQNDQLAPFSNFGVSSVHVGAPGVYILSTVPTYSSPTGYDFNAGTSMAAPHVSGLAGLLFSYYTHFNRYQIINTIFRYVDLTSISGWVVKYGRINAYHALSSLLPPTDLTAILQSHTEIMLTWTDVATGEDAYTIERKTSGGSYEVLSSSLPPDTTSYTDSGLIKGEVYTYRVKATNTLPAESLYSTEVTEITPLTITISKAGTGNCTITSNPSGLNCGDFCSTPFSVGTEVTLIIVTDEGSSFIGWSGDVDCTDGQLTMNADKNCTAMCNLLMHTLDVTKAGAGLGTVTSSPVGIDCGTDCSESYEYGAAVTLTAHPDGDSVFAGWNGGGCFGTGQCVTSINADTNITATFNLKTYSLNVTKAGSGSGTVTSNPSGVDCGTDCEQTYDTGTSVTLTALPDVGSHFIGWSGECTGSDTTCIVTVDGIKNVTATFDLKQRILTVNKDGTGAGTVTSSLSGIDCGIDCSEIYNHGTSVTLTAIQDEGSDFTGWTGGGCSGTGQCVVTMNADTNVTATFTLSSGPDLVGSWISMVQNCKVKKKGTKCKLQGKLMIQNIGNEDAGLSYVRFYLSDDEIYDGSDTLLKEVSTGKKMKVGKIKNKKLKYKLPIDETANGKYLIAIIDANNTVTEAIESNNHVINGPIPAFP